MKKSIANEALKSDPSEIVQKFLESFSAPKGLDEVISLVDVSSRLVETAAFDAAGSVSEEEVVGLIRLAAQLEASANKLRGIQFS